MRYRIVPEIQLQNFRRSLIFEINFSPAADVSFAQQRALMQGTSAPRLRKMTCSNAHQLSWTIKYPEILTSPSSGDCYSCDTRVLRLFISYMPLGVEKDAEFGLIQKLDMRDVT